MTVKKRTKKNIGIRKAKNYAQREETNPNRKNKWEGEEKPFNKKERQEENRKIN